MTHVTEEMVEAGAIPIYDAMPYDGPKGTTKPAWVLGGNSLKQDEARRMSRKVLTAAMSARPDVVEVKEIIKSLRCATHLADQDGLFAPGLPKRAAVLLEAHAGGGVEDGLLRLTADEGDSVTVLCENPDGNGPNNRAVDCCGQWTDWKDRRFYGHTIKDALNVALAALPKDPTP